MRIVEEGAKSAPTSTIFIYMLGSKAMGSSLTSQIVVKTTTNCDARLDAMNNLTIILDKLFLFINNSWNIVQIVISNIKRAYL